MAQLNYDWNVNDLDYSRGYDKYSSTAREVLAATAQEVWRFNPIQAFKTYYDIEQAAADDFQKDLSPLNKDELNKKYNSIGLNFDEDEYPSVVNIMVEQKKAERERQQIIESGPSGFAIGAAKLGVGIGTTLLDPINIAAAFFPVVGQARFASMVSRFSDGKRLSALSKARLTTGVTEGVVGAAVLEGLVAQPLSRKVQADYTLLDSFLNISFGAVLGGGLHLGAGKLRDRGVYKKFQEQIKTAKKIKGVDESQAKQMALYKEYFPENANFMRELAETKPIVKRQLLQKATNDFLTERQIDISTLTDADLKLKGKGETPAQPKPKLKQSAPKDEIELNNVEKGIINKDATDIEKDIANLEVRADEMRARQKDVNLKDFDKEFEQVQKDIDDFTTEEANIKKAFIEGINCMNGR